MEPFLSKEVLAGLARMRRKARKQSSRLQLTAGDTIWPVKRLWATGFALDASAPPLRGQVDLYDGSRHLFQCLIMTSEEAAGERQFEFKRATAVADGPALDFEIEREVPVPSIVHRRSTANR